VTPLSRGDGNEGFLETIMFSDEVAFPLSVNVQRHGVGVWSDENPCEKIERILVDQLLFPLCYLWRERSVVSLKMDMLQQVAISQVGGRLDTALIFK
jgi:hypothetical protein